VSSEHQPKSWATFVVAKQDDVRANNKQFNKENPAPRSSASPTLAKTRLSAATRLHDVFEFPIPAGQPGSTALLTMHLTSGHLPP